MELDELKNLLNKKLEQPAASLDQWGIQRSINGKTKSILSKIKRSIWFEIICAAIITLLFVYITLFSSWQAFRIYFGTFSLLLFLFIPVLLMLLKKVNALLYKNVSVKPNLESLVKILKEYIKRYYQLSMALIPVCVIYSFLLGYNEGKNTSHPAVDKVLVNLKNAGHLSPTLIIIISLIYMIILAVVMHFFCKWYLNKIYGKYLTELEKNIAVLEE